MVEQSTKFVEVQKEDTENGSYFLIYIPFFEKGKNSLVITNDQTNDKSGYEIRFLIPDVFVSTILGETKVVDADGKEIPFSEIHGLGESDCLECPLYSNESEKGNEELLADKLGHELFAIVLLDVIREYYLNGEKVPWEIKDAYNFCVGKAGHCEPLETQTPIF